MKALSRRPAPRGFTLVEVMVTLVVIGILAAVALPWYQTYTTRARVSEALVFADAARTRVDLPLMQGRMAQDIDKDLLASAGKAIDMINKVQWVPASTAANPSVPANDLVGFILVEMKLPGLGDAPVNALALQRMAQGAWICTSAAKVSVPDAKVLPLEEKYLPATCHGDGSALAAAPASTCPPGQDMVTLSTAGRSNSACTPKCAAGQTRDPANPTQCNGVAVANVPSTPVPTAQPAINSVAPASLAAKPAAVPVGTANRPGAAVQAPLQCHTCDPAVPELCELVTVETTCTYPKNYCMTAVDNHADGSKDVKRYCGDYAEMYREWWLGTSDDDKCRSVDQGVSLDFRCTFACETPNCNQNGNVRPPEDSLFRDR